MVEVIRTITNVPAIVETRLSEFTVRNLLDAKGLPGTPGKYIMTVKTVDEQQTEDRTLIMNNGIPVRTANNPIEFDPMLYAAVQITREDGTTFYLGNLLADVIVAIDTLKGGLPSLVSVPEPQPEPQPQPETP